MDNILFMTIEECLGLTPVEIDRRKEEIIGNIPTFPGTEFLKVKLKRFEVQPWPLLLYAAYWAPDELQNLISCYRDYDGSENAFAVLEDLKEYYILGKLLKEYNDKYKLD